MPKMRRSAMISSPVIRRMKPSLSLVGKHARPLLRTQIGKLVSLQVRGRVVNQGIDIYENGRPQRATLEVDSVGQVK